MQLRTDLDLLDAIWPDRPALPAQPVYEHRAAAGHRAARAKLAAVREAMARHGATHHFVSTVDDIAWITNLRGSDVSYNPVFLAHLLLDLTGATLFVGAGKVDAALAARLAADGVQLAPYAAGRRRAGRAGRRRHAAGRPQARHARPARSRSAAARTVVEAINPSTLLKSRKTAAEAAFVREAMAEDGAAMCEFYAWFEAALARGERITELTIDEQLSAARARRAGFVGLSFSDHRRLQRQRRDAALPRHRRVARRDRRRRPAAHRQRRPVPGRHHRHHARVAHRHASARR